MKKKKGEIIKPETLLPTKQPSEELEVLGYIKQGLSRAEIKVIYKSWGANKFNALWKRATTLMKQAVAEQEEARAEAVMMYRDLYSQNYELGFLKECRNCLDSMCKVQGLTKDGVTVANEFITVWG